MKKIVATLCAALAGAGGIMLAFTVAAPADTGSPSTSGITLCHHTGDSKAHEWVEISPDASGVFAGHANVNHQEFQFGPEDIIPAFQFTDAHGDVHTYAGQNLTTTYDVSLEPVVAGPFTGAVILANHCVAPTTPPTTTTTPGQTTTMTTTVTVPGQTTTVTVPGQTTTITVPGQTTTVATPPPPPVTVTSAAATTTVTTPAPPPVTTTVTVPSPPKVVTKTKTKIVTKVVVKWHTRLRLVHKCMKVAKTP